MSDYLIAFLLLIALASVGSFAGASGSLTIECSAHWFPLCN